MPRISGLGPDYFVTGQIGVEDVADIAAQGFKTIVNNRPDSEGGPAQPKSSDLEAEADRHGLVYLHLPMERVAVDPRLANEFSRTLAMSPRPVIGFCRTGARASALYYASTRGRGNQLRDLS